MTSARDLRTRLGVPSRTFREWRSAGLIPLGTAGYRNSAIYTDQECAEIEAFVLARKNKKPGPSANQRRKQVRYNNQRPLTAWVSHNEEN